MPNPIDQSRVNDSARGATITDINVFKAQRGDVSISAPYFAMGAGTFVLFALLVFVFLFFGRK